MPELHYRMQQEIVRILYLFFGGRAAVLQISCGKVARANAKCRILADYLGCARPVIPAKGHGLRWQRIMLDAMTDNRSPGQHSHARGHENRLFPVAGKHFPIQNNRHRQQAGKESRPNCAHARCHQEGHSEGGNYTTRKPRRQARQMHIALFACLSPLGIIPQCTCDFTSRQPSRAGQQNNQKRCVQIYQREEARRRSVGQANANHLRLRGTVSPAHLR